MVVPTEDLVPADYTFATKLFSNMGWELYTALDWNDPVVQILAEYRKYLENENT